MILYMWLALTGGMPDDTVTLDTIHVYYDTAFDDTERGPEPDATDDPDYGMSPLITTDPVFWLPQMESRTHSL